MPTLPWARGYAAAAPTDAVVVLASRLELGSYWPMLGFLRAAVAVRKQVRASPGALGVSLVAQLRGKTFWTLSAWVDQAALNAFVSKAPHRDVMSHYGPDLAGSKFATFTIRPDQVPKPNSKASDLWRNAREHLRAVRLKELVMDVSLDGWNIVAADDAEWMPWVGSAGEARAKVLGAADGYTVMFVEAQPGYKGNPHEHGYAEFNFVVAGTVWNQGVEMKAGDGYAAAAGSTHADFETETGATYIVIFKL